MGSFCSTRGVSAGHVLCVGCRRNTCWLWGPDVHYWSRFCSASCPCEYSVIPSSAWLCRGFFGDDDTKMLWAELLPFLLPVVVTGVASLTNHQVLLLALALTSCVNLSCLTGNRMVFSEFFSSYNILFSMRMKEYYAQSQKSVRRASVGPEARGNANSIWFSKRIYWNHSLKKTCLL